MADENIQCEHCGHVTVVETLGERGPKGDQGDRGPRGKQGERGFRGERGASGEGITLRDVVEHERDLPKEAVTGDAFIVKPEDSDEGHLYVYTDSGNNVCKWLDVGSFKGDTGKSLRFDWDGKKLGVKSVGDQSYEYQDLQGPAGRAGPEGPRGERGERGPAGERGPKGDVGEGLEIKGSRDSEADLPDSASIGDGYIIDGNLYVYTGGNN